ncbi:hypothetical protein AN944_00319 [Shewanella sp. P1-14-1]|uniref:DP-EP family protein n=1 Tax=Shewanella sp. P1-14-1 TaxID=1723761 RepID=UPI0006D6738B|nr:DP-EP family protein [Shewanella sp. P1-14-1]KPZ73171.1 hypothetical protein AN944_00319 [Shewanella sp. P1-14-1]
MENTTGHAIFITLTVTLGKNNIPIFSYSNNDEPIIITKKSVITYELSDETEKGLKFIGATFDTPFDGIIDAVTVSNDGQLIHLLDLDQITGKTNFQFVLSNAQNSLMLISKDPQVINREEN